MPVDMLTVPPANKVAPQQPQTTKQQPNAADQENATNTAVSKLRQKNRRANTFQITIPGPVLSFESGTTYNLQGFTPNSDSQKYVLEQVEFRFRGGSGGSTTSLRFRPAVPQITGSSSQ